MKGIREVEGRMRLEYRIRLCKEAVTEYRSYGCVEVTANALSSPQTRFELVGKTGSVITNESMKLSESNVTNFHRHHVFP